MRHPNKRKILLGAFIMAGFFTICTSEAQAEKVAREVIEKHLDAMVALYNKDKIDMTEIYNFIKAYAEKGAIFKTNSYFNGAEQPIMKSSDTAQILKMTKRVQERYVKAMARYEIMEYKDNPDGLTADVRYKLWHDATIELDVSPTEVEQTSYETVSDCTEKFKLEGTQVKGLDSVCEMHVKQDKPVKLPKTGQ
jgi:uncharacterized protein involved in tolerance to divalent cations